MNKLVKFSVFVYRKLKGRPEFFTAVDQLLTDKFKYISAYMAYVFFPKKKKFFYVNVSSVSLCLPAGIPGVVTFGDSSSECKAAVEHSMFGPEDILSS